MAYLDDVKKKSILDFQIVDYNINLEEGITELIATNPEDAMSWGYAEFDRKLGYILPGQLILVGGVTGTGKTTFVNEVGRNISGQGFKVGKFSLEDRNQDKKKQELYFEVGRIRKKWGKPNFPMSEFMINGIIHQDDVLDKAKDALLERNKNILEIKKTTAKRINIDTLEVLIQEFIKRDVKLIIIDHLGEFDLGGTDKERNDLKVENIMYAIKDMGRRYNIAIIMIVHYKKLNGKKPDDESFKESIAITQVANKVLHLYRDKLDENAMTELIITKNRDNPYGTGTLELNFNKELGGYEGIKSKRMLGESIL